MTRTCSRRWRGRREACRRCSAGGDEVPLVDDDDDAAAALVGVAADGGVGLAVTPSVASMMTSATSAASRCLRAMTTDSFSAIRWVLPLRRMPAVSTKRKVVAFVVHNFVDGIAGGAGDGRDDGADVPVRALSRVDLPTLGRPMMATWFRAARMRRGCVLSSSSSSRFRLACGPFLHRDRVARSGGRGFGGSGGSVGSVRHRVVLRSGITRRRHRRAARRCCCHARRRWR
jgi:hypothetical protein